MKFIAKKEVIGNLNKKLNESEIVAYQRMGCDIYFLRKNKLFEKKFMW